MLWDIRFGSECRMDRRSFTEWPSRRLSISQCALALATAAIGVWGASRAAKFWQQEVPNVSSSMSFGQHLTLLLGCAVPIWWKPTPMWSSPPIGLVTTHSALNWKYLVLGFILFRVFDIWKPFPARQAESLARRLGYHGGRLDGGDLRGDRVVDRASGRAVMGARKTAAFAAVCWNALGCTSQTVLHFAQNDGDES